MNSLNRCHPLVECSKAVFARYTIYKDSLVSNFARSLKHGDHRCCWKEGIRRSTSSHDTLHPPLTSKSHLCSKLFWIKCNAPEYITMYLFFFFFPNFYTFIVRVLCFFWYFAIETNHVFFIFFFAASFFHLVVRDLDTLKKLMFNRYYRNLWQITTVYNYIFFYLICITNMSIPVVGCFKWRDSFIFNLVYRV